MTPINVYLDNSDLSRLFKAQTKELASIRSELLTFKESGAVRYSFSFWHIVEFIQRPAPGYREEHRRKAVFLQELCGEKRASTLPRYPR